MQYKDAAIGTSFDEHVVGGYKFLMQYYSPVCDSTTSSHDIELIREPKGRRYIHVWFFSRELHCSVPRRNARLDGFDYIWQ